MEQHFREFSGPIVSGASRVKAVLSQLAIDAARRDPHDARHLGLISPGALQRHGQQGPFTRLEAACQISVMGAEQSFPHWQVTVTGWIRFGLRSATCHFVLDLPGRRGDSSLARALRDFQVFQSIPSTEYGYRNRSALFASCLH